ncbi:MAG: recombinase family protein, partial [Oscillospiraceae bacterium]|nr:recombinase family protein [Oscillospiraceae bacterium]
LIAWFNELIANDDIDKIRRVLRHKKENGLLISTPFGYRKEGGGMVIDSDTAPTVVKIFDMALNGSTASQIADYLNTSGAKTPGNSSAWTRDSVRVILKNPCYTGTLVSAKRQKLSYKSKKMVPLSEDRRIIIPNHHEAIVGKSEFEKRR